MDGTMVQDTTLINPPHPSKQGVWLHLGQHKPLGGKTAQWHYFEQVGDKWISHHQCTAAELERIATAISDGIEFTEQNISLSTTLYYRRYKEE